MMMMMVKYRVSQKRPPMLLELVETPGHVFGTPGSNGVCGGGGGGGCDSGCDSGCGGVLVMNVVK